MTEMEKPNYIQRNRSGGVRRVFCKVCAYVIAEQRGRMFWRSRLYSEMKIKFADGTAHVTNLCKECTSVARRDPELLMKIYEADIDDLCIDNQQMEIFRIGKEKPRVVAIDNTGRGIR
jgi:hypothetical protein